MDHLVHRVLRFDRFTLDLERGCLRAGDQDIELRPKTFEVLRYLAGNAGRLVPKQEFYDSVWPNVTVCDDSLVQCIRELRQKLGDDDRRLIKTMSRRGYLLDAAVSAQPPRSFSDGSVVQVPEVRQRLTTELRLPHHVLWPVAIHKLRKWAAPTLMLSSIAVIAVLDVGNHSFFVSWGPQGRIAELQSRADKDEALFDGTTATLGQYVKMWSSGAHLPEGQARISELETAYCTARHPDALARIPPPGSVSCRQEVMVLDGTCGPGKITKIVGGCNLDSAGRWTSGSRRMTSCVSC